MKEQGDSKYKRLIDTFFMEVKRVFRPYSGKFSKRTYTQHQLAVAILLMKYERKTYRDIADLLKELWPYFGLDGPIPHFTTLEKFFMRIPTYIRDFLLAKTYELFEGDVANVAIDSTGYGLHHASQHYEKRIGRRKRYMKHFLSVDTDNHAIVASEDWRSYVNDSTRFRPILSKTVGRRKVHDATADKGFDAEENHRFAHKIGVDSIIPLRRDVPVLKTKGRYGKRLRRYFPQERYNRRPIVETVNSVEKRKFGDDLRSRLLKTQRREMKVVDVVYNIHRYINYVVSAVVGFLQSHDFY
ncbi:MAG: IS5 family transposase [Candidatus Marsarchaeota archaeon]|jgi:hypothetical protein|nr:IS5 family transposase [Candidatus Marsarchaeota archaeon]MCL5111263.1 IS5 family transposase [Candidatus Marsarchaeota archaeon]